MRYKTNLHPAAVVLLLVATATAQHRDPGAPPPKLHPVADTPAPRLQAPAADAGPGAQTKRDGQAAIPNLFADPDTVWLDRPTAGEVWARGSSYKAGFTPSGLEYVPFFGSDAPRNYPVAFRLTGATLAGRPMPLRTATVQAGDRQVHLDHGVLRERFDLTGTGIEQTFVFDDLPQRGDLALAIAVNTDLVPATTATGLVFTHAELGAVRYEHAVAIDGAGRRLTLPIRFEHGTIRLEVPAAFVEAAALPLLVDPLLATMATTAVTGAYVGNPDVAVYWNTSRNVESCVVWRQNFSSTDVDVWARMYTDQNPALAFGGVIPIDITATTWEAPRVAAIQGPVNWTYLFVAQCSNGSVSPWWIGGRLMPYEYPYSFPNRPQFRISPTTITNDCINPDVGGGDAYEYLPGTFTVVYQYAYSAADHDIYGQQVDAAGNVLAGIRYIDTSTAFESRPRIASKAGIQSGTKWPIVYQRGNPAVDVDIRGGFLGGNGHATHLFAVSVGGSYDHQPAVSSFTERGSFAMFAWERVGGGDNQIFGAVFDNSGVLRTTADLGALEGAPPWAQFSPSVDTDGGRFAVAYTEYYQNNPSDPDALVAVFGFAAGSNQLSALQSHTYLAGTIDREYAPSIAAARPFPVYYPLSHQFVATCQFDNGPTFGVRSFLYDAAQLFAGYTRRSTGCGNGVTIGDPRQPGANFTVTPHLGQALQFSMSGPPGFQLLLFGFPATTPVSGCPGCTIGVNGNSVPNHHVFSIPIGGWLVGLPLSVQGVSFAGGSCYGALSLTDTVDFTIL